MKILHITTYDTGGAGIAAIRIHQVLLKHGLKSKVLCLKKQNNNVKEVYAWDQYKSVTLVERLHKKTGLFKSYVQKLKDKIKGLDGKYELFSLPYTNYHLHNHPLVKEADIIHLHWIAGFIDYGSFFTKVSKPIVWTTHDLNPVLGGFHYENDIDANKSFGQIELELRQYKHALINNHKIQFVGVSSWTKTKIQSYLGNSACVSSIHVPIDFSEFRPVDKELAKNALGIDSSKIIIGIGAQFFDNYRKGYWLFEEAYNQLNEGDKINIQIVSFGSSDSKNQISESILSFGRVENNSFQSLLYSAMDLFILPSLEETLGLTGVEAICCGTPVLGSRVGGITDYLFDRVNGILFKSEDSHDLLAKLKLLINNKELLATLSERSKETVVDIFGQDIIASSYINLYKSL